MAENRRRARIPPGARIKLAHHTIDVDHLATGITIGGAGLPLVFMHGIGLNRMPYLRVLSRLPQLGFRVVAIDAPGHGETAALPRDADDFAARVLFTARVIETLGIRRALLVGHSMGGRTAAELAALWPHRALGVILINAALGEDFDTSRAAINSRPKLAGAVATAVYDSVADRVGFVSRDRLRYMLALSRAAGRTLVRPGEMAAAARAMAFAVDSTLALDVVRRHGVPVAVIHGEHDRIVPLSSALATARRTHATTITLPNAYHSWVLSHPRTLVKIVSGLLADDSFGPAFHDRLEVAEDPRRAARRAAAAEGLYEDDSLAVRLCPPIELLGGPETISRAQLHPYRRRR